MTETTTRPHSALDDFGIFRKSDGQPNALDKLTRWDVVASGALFNEKERDEVPLLEQCAVLIGQLWGVDYYADAGSRSRKDMKGAARWVLIDQNGDIDALRAAHDDMIIDEMISGACALCQSPYAVARKMYNHMAKMKAAERRKANKDAETSAKYRTMGVGLTREAECPKCSGLFDVKGEGLPKCDECGIELVPVKRT